MIGIDTNILLRFILADDPAQFALAKDFFDRRSLAEPAFVSLLVLAEACWVLRRSYAYTNAEIEDVFQKLVLVEEIVFEDEDFVDILMTDGIKAGSDISDYLIAHLADRAGCGKTVTFDRVAAVEIPGMELLA